jgi:hypothetical protein
VRVSDGVVLGSTPLRKEMPYGEGKTEIELRLDGYQPVPMELRNDEDQTPKSASMQRLAPIKGKGKKDKLGAALKQEKIGAGTKPKEAVPTKPKQKKKNGETSNDDIAPLK